MVSPAAGCQRHWGSIQIPLPVRLVGRPWVLCTVDIHHQKPGGRQPDIGVGLTPTPGPDASFVGGRVLAAVRRRGRLAAWPAREHSIPEPGIRITPPL